MVRITAEARRARARDRAKKLIVGLVAASDGKLVGKLRLYKAFCRAHLLYFEETGLELTGYPIVHMPNGPGIDNAAELIDELRQDGVLNEAIGNTDRAHERIYTTVGEATVEQDPEKSEAIRKAVEWANALTYKELKDGSHNRSWRESGMGAEQNVFLDVVEDARIDDMRAEAKSRLARMQSLASA